ncbi:MAG: hypothetical protein Tsb009_33270 [Planctomycetaceae bacterium]
MNRNFQNVTPPDHSGIPTPLVRAKARILLDTDLMRTGIPAHIFELSTGWLGLQLGTVIPVGEMIKIELRNEIQRIERTVRGAVREQVPFKENLHRIRVELFSRLTPYDVLLLKTSLKN